MRISNELRIIANNLEDIQENKEKLLAKEVWEATNEIRERLIKILESDLFSNL